ncbi:FFLEELY motif protein [Pseudoduganella namucuonensis]|uniref:DUF8198 domain-containing protein n=1 Tax=Pseudoduganella namucuonensis TaxID=1035707 RepID=A0A1I7J663_9BURK|nr:hypothetical protein [Pseudoduganella namucuonensis]SFU80624.1 hypothetical protein SAMN05216552_101091 [Pseudoduganella namucuonensis]
MKKKSNPSPLEQRLREARLERQADGGDPALRAARLALKTFQSRRLAATHADLLDDRDSHAAVMFFLDELYGTHDLSQRDTDLERIAPTMQKVLPADALQTITEAMRLDALAERLDTAMARLLGPAFGEADYIEAYREAMERADRERQLDLVQALGDSLSELVRVPMLHGTLVLMRRPARLAGLGNLQQFLERGFSAFKRMRKPREFVDTIVRRERAILERLYARHPAPFELD